MSSSTCAARAETLCTLKKKESVLMHWLRIDAEMDQKIPTELITLIVLFARNLTVRFPPDMASSGMHISNRSRVVSDNDRYYNGAFALSNEIYMAGSGIHVFQIEIISRFKIVIGVVDAWKFMEFGRRGWAPGDTRGSYGYHCVGSKGINGRWTDDYAEPYGAKDIVECQIDTNNRILTFYKNGQSQGIACEGITLPVRPAIYLRESKIKSLDC